MPLTLLLSGLVQSEHHFKKKTKKDYTLFQKVLSEVPLIGTFGKHENLSEIK